MSRRNNHDAASKALEAVKGVRSVSELASEYGVYLTMIHQWKRSHLEDAAEIFEREDRATATAELAEETVRDEIVKRLYYDNLISY